MARDLTFLSALSLTSLGSWINFVDVYLFWQLARNAYIENVPPKIDCPGFHSALVNEGFPLAWCVGRVYTLERDIKGRL